VDLHLVIRWLHVGAGMVLVGGAALLAFRFAAAEPSLEGTWTIARRYEWLCWAALAVLVASGIGNLGGFGAAMPDARSSWGQAFLVKLTLVMVLATLSVVRTAAVVQLAGSAATFPGALRGLYAVTALLGVAIAGAAQLMAHG
jgi:uncharacterized membrane protein